MTDIRARDGFRPGKTRPRWEYAALVALTYPVFLAVVALKTLIRPLAGSDAGGAGLFSRALTETRSVVSIAFMG
jgi:hypothetical protein